MPTKLDVGRVPESLRALINVAESWGIPDDYERERKLSNATTVELLALVSSIDGIPDEALFGWLEGPESDSLVPSDEYACFTCLVMAIDSAKLKLARKKERQSGP